MIQLPFPLDIQQPLAAGITCLSVMWVLSWVQYRYLAGSTRTRAVVDFLITRRCRNIVRQSYRNLSAEEQEEQAQRLLHLSLKGCIGMFGLMGAVPLLSELGVIQGKPVPRQELPPELEKKFQEWRRR